MRCRRSAVALVGAALLAAGCGSSGDGSTAEATRPAVTASAAPSGSRVLMSAPPVPPSAAALAPKPRRVVVRTGFRTFASAGNVVLRLPAALVERVGFHQSNHEGARILTVLPGAVDAVTLETRGRLTRARTAADVVVDPRTAIRAPVSGRVKRAGTYVLYCKHSDDFVVIAPDARPAWEVKILHIDGVRVRPGDRVVAGVTVIAPRATQLPFESQVDELATVKPAWPHVHIEVVDPAIPNKPSPNSGC